MLFVGVGIGSYYQKGSQGGIGPDNYLYAVDKAVEWAELNVFTWSDSRRLELRLAMMQERIDELSKLAEEDKLTETYRQKLEREYQKLAEKAIDALAERAKKEADIRSQELLAHLKETIDNQRTSLYSVIQNTPQNAENVMKDAFKALEGAYRETVDIVKGS